LFTSVVDFFNTHMTEISKSLCLEFAKNGRIVCDTEEAAHEAGDLLLAGLQPLDYLKFKLHRLAKSLFSSCTVT
jgi:ornithine cyclodeaminase